jgi:anti-sigma factor RsiW
VKCEEARAALLSGSDIEPVRQHLETCRVCRSEEPLWAKLRSALSSHSLWEEPPPDLADKIVRAGDGQIETSRAEARTTFGRGRTAALAGVAVTLLIALAGTIVATHTLSADWEMTLVATEESPQATASISGWSTARGTRMVIDISGIEDAPTGSYYEIWMTAPDGRHVSAGTFTGSGRVTAFAGVRRADYPRIWITMEMADDDLGPSREAYFDTA